MVKPNQLVEFSSEDKKIKIFCDSDTPLGNIHDFLMQVKGYIVDRMVAAHQEEEAASKAQKETDCCKE